MNVISNLTLQHLRSVTDLPDLSGTKYRIIDRVGSGGMGVVYRAEDQSLKRTVALKVMSASLDSGKLSVRMMREAEVIARLEHPGIVPIHDVGVLPDGRPFYVMKFVEGKRLDEVVRHGLPQPELLRLFQKICEAVGFAHTRGVLHRDLKPENVMVGSFGEVLVMDWGIAKILNGNNENKTAVNVSDVGGQSSIRGTTETAAGTIIGTPAYMAPEQKSGDTTLQDVRTDIYALGAILYFILTGSPPQKEEPIVKPRDVSREIPRQLEAICLRAMAFAPSGRYTSALDCAADITRFLDNLSVSAYRENIFEKIVRFLSKNWFLVWLVLAYLIMRAIVFFFLGR